MSPRATEITGVGVLDKGIAILDLLESRPMSISELAALTGMATSTTHRLVSALAKHGLVRRDDDARFHLGPRFTQVALIEVARPILERLRDETGESVQLWVRRGAYRLCAFSADSREELRVTLEAGSFLPLPDGSAGQVLAGESALEDGGWIESQATRAAGIGSVSAPVTAHGYTVAAVCLAGPLARLVPGPGRVHGRSVAEAASQIERMLPA